MSGAVMLEQEGGIPKLFSQNWKHKIVQNCLGMLKHLKLFLLKLMGHFQPLKKTLHHNVINPPSTELYTWQNAVRQVLFSWQPPNPDSSIGLPDREAEFITPENMS